MTLLTSTHSSTGARLAPEGAPLPVLVHGSVPDEYAAATSNWVIFDRSNLGRLDIAGADAEAFLVRILAGDVRRLEENQVHRNMLLSPKGKVQQLFELARLSKGYEATTAPGQAPALAQGLDMYHFGEDLQCTDRTAEFAHFDLLGPDVDTQLPSAWGASLPANLGEATSGEFAGQTISLQRVLVAGRPGVRLCTPTQTAAGLWETLVGAGAVPAGLVTFDALRAEAGFGLWGTDIDDTVYPQEARLDDGFSLTKGCYIGQEVVAKIDTYGGLNKRMLLLRVSSDEPVAPGTRLLEGESKAGAESRDLGVATSWAYSFALDHGVVLGYVKRKHQEPGTTFRLGETGHTATVIDWPYGPARAADSEAASG